jgi:putative transposase
VWHENFCVYGSRKAWKQLNRERIRVAKCTVERLMRQLSLRGATLCKCVVTTLRDPKAERAVDLVDRKFYTDAPDRLWVADISVPQQAA